MAPGQRQESPGSSLKLVVMYRSACDPPSRGSASELLRRDLLLDESHALGPIEPQVAHPCALLQGRGRDGHGRSLEPPRCPVLSWKSFSASQSPRTKDNGQNARYGRNSKTKCVQERPCVIFFQRQRTKRAVRRKVSLICQTHFSHHDGKLHYFRISNCRTMLRERLPRPRHECTNDARKFITHDDFECLFPILVGSTTHSYVAPDQVSAHTTFLQLLSIPLSDVQPVRGVAYQQAKVEQIPFYTCKSEEPATITRSICQLRRLRFHSAPPSARFQSWDGCPLQPEPL